MNETTTETRLPLAEALDAAERDVTVFRDYRAAQREQTIDSAAVWWPIAATGTGGDPTPGPWTLAAAREDEQRDYAEEDANRALMRET